MFDVNVHLPDWPEKFMLEVYSDTASPAAKEFGESLKKLTGAIKCVTVPFAMMGYTAEYLEERFINFLEESLKSVKRENLQKPDPMIAAQIIRDVVYAFDQKELYKLYKHLWPPQQTKQKVHLYIRLSCHVSRNWIRLIFLYWISFLIKASFRMLKSL